MEILLDRIKELCKTRSITVTMLEIKLGFPKNTIYQWKKRVPGTEKLREVADFFDVSIDYLLGRDSNTSLAEKHGVFAFDGDPVTDEEVEFLKSVLAAKRAAENK